MNVQSLQMQRCLKANICASCAWALNVHLHLALLGLRVIVLRGAVSFSLF